MYIFLWIDIQIAVFQRQICIFAHFLFKPCIDFLFFKNWQFWTFTLLVAKIWLFTEIGRVVVSISGKITGLFYSETSVVNSLSLFIFLDISSLFISLQGSNFQSILQFWPLSHLSRIKSKKNALFRTLKYCPKVPKSLKLPAQLYHFKSAMCPPEWMNNSLWYCKKGDHQCLSLSYDPVCYMPTPSPSAALLSRAKLHDIPVYRFGCTFSGTQAGKLAFTMTPIQSQGASRLGKCYSVVK